MRGTYYLIMSLNKKTLCFMLCHNHYCCKNTILFHFSVDVLKVVTHVMFIFQQQNLIRFTQPISRRYQVLP